MTQKNSNTSSGYPKLDEWVTIWRETLPKYFGYPFNEVSPLRDFYEWYYAAGINLMNLNNAGDPFTSTPWEVSSQVFEREVIEFFAPLYDFDADNMWGLVTHSGSDGNNHGIYFGANYLKQKTGQAPILYVSDEAHYSNMRLAHLQNLETRLVKSDTMGRMIPDELERQLDTSRPALVVYAMGSTFKGAIDDMPALNSVLHRHSELPAIYRHVDAALFGGYLPFTRHRQLVSSKKMGFESIAVSGHKFFGIDTRDIRQSSRLRHTISEQEHAHDQLFARPHPTAQILVGHPESGSRRVDAPGPSHIGTDSLSKAATR